MRGISKMSYKQSLGLFFVIVLIGIIVINNVSSQEITPSNYSSYSNQMITDNFNIYFKNNTNLDTAVFPIFIDPTIIIEINDADHLDSNRAFIRDIYENVSRLDNITATIPQNEYVRIKFEQNLDSEKDITIYAKSNDNAIVEVYEKDSNSLLATFNEINEIMSNYRQLLTNLNGTQDTFDLKIIGGSVEFDYITDPTYINYTTGQAVYGVFADGISTNFLNLTCQLRACALSDCSGASWVTYTNNTFSSLSSLPNVSYFQYKATFFTENQNYTPYLFNFTIGYTLLGGLAPTISIVYPSQDGLWLSNNTIEINYTFSEVSPNTCWWNLNNGANTTITCGQNITGQTWNQGVNNVTIYINNSGGLSASATRSFNVDTINPNATLIFPTNSSYNSTTSQNFTTNLTDNIGLKNATLIIYNQTGEYNRTSITFVSDTIQTTLGIVVTMIDGVYNWFYKVFDWSGNNYATQNNTLTIDTVLPSLSFTYPLNNSYNIIPTAINYTYVDINPNSCWYSTNTGVSNTTITCGQNVTGLSANQGSNTWMVALNDSANNKNQTYITFFVDTINPTINFTSPTETSGTYQNRNNIQINVTSIDANLANITIYLYNLTGYINSTNTTTSPNFVNYTGLVDGIYFFNSTSRDTLNNANFTETKNVTIDLTNPLVSYGTGTQNNGVNLSQNFIYINTSWTEINFANITFTLKNLTATVNSTTYTTAITIINWTNLPDTTYTYYVNITDLANNKNSTTIYTITLDNTNPSATLVSPGNGTFNSTVTQNFTSTISDNLGIKNATLYIYNQSGLYNSTTTTYTPNTVAATLGIVVSLVDNVYNWWFSIWDWAGNTYTTDNNTITIDTTSPLFSNNLTSITNGAEYSPGNSYQFNITIENTNGTAGIEFNGINYSLSNISSSFYWSAGNLGVGNYNYYFWSYGNGTIHNFNVSQTYSYTIAKNSSLVLGLTATTPITYPTITDFTGSGCPSQLTCSLNISNAIYGAGTVSANYSTIGNANYSATSTTFTVTINQNSTYNVSVFGTTPLTYPSPAGVSNSSCPSQITCNLYRNNTGAITSPDNTVLTAGSYNYTFNTTGNTNYSAKSSSFVLTINQNTSSCNIIFNTTSPQTYPAKFRVYSNCTSAFYITRNGTIVANNSEQDLSSGTYNFTVFRTDTANYTNIVDQANFTITQGTPVITKKLNSGTSNITITYPQQLNTTASSTGGTINIYRDTTDVTSENSLNVTLSAGGYIYKFNVTGNTNWTSIAGEYMQVNISKATPTLTFKANGGTSNLTLNYPQQVNISATSNTGTVGLDKDNVNYSNNGLNVTLSVGSYIFRANVTGNSNYSNVGYSYYNITINQGSAVVYTYLNNSRVNITIMNGTSIWLNATRQAGEGIIQLYNNGTLINSGTSPLSNLTNFTELGLFNITAIYPATTNYTMSYETWWVNVTNTNITPSLYCGDGTCNNGETCSTCAGDCGSCGGGGSGGSGGGTSAKSFWDFTYSNDYKELKNLPPVLQSLEEKQRVSILVNSETHFVGVIDITNDKVTINVSSNKSQQVILRPGEAAKFEINNDLYYDLKISLNNIFKTIGTNKANLTITYIHEGMPNGLIENLITPDNRANEKNNPLKLFDIKLELEDITLNKANELVSIITFASFGNVPTPVDLTYSILDSSGAEVYSEKGSVTVTTEQIVRKNFESLNLPAGKYTLVLTTVYGNNVKDEFRQEFEVGKTGFLQSIKNNWIWFLVIVGAILALIIVIIIYKFHRKRRFHKWGY